MAHLEKVGGKRLLIRSRDSFDQSRKRGMLSDSATFFRLWRASITGLSIFPDKSNDMFFIDYSGGFDVSLVACCQEIRWNMRDI